MFYIKRWWQKEGRGVNFVNPMVDPYGGSENRTIALCQSVSTLAPSRIWSDRRVSTLLRNRARIENVRPPFHYPFGGNLVFVGAYFRLGDWIRLTAPRRIITLFNTPDLIDLQTFMSGMDRLGMGKVIEIVYSSTWLRDRAGIPGEVHQSPIDLMRFAPQGKKERPRTFTVGRLSRDVPSKFHPNDVKLFLELANKGYNVRIMGGTCLAGSLKHERIELLPAGHEPPEVFLSSLDAFLYRTNHEEFFETFGRVVFEAMACGLPVVCGAQGGYRDNICHGENGVLFEENAEAVEWLDLLRNSQTIRNDMGRKARSCVEGLFSESALREMAKFYAE